jgi:hypothetical protein
MNINISVKQLGKKYPILEQKSVDFVVTNPLIATRKFIELIVEHQVQLFNSSSFVFDDTDKIHLPNENYLPILTDTGKAGFGSIYNYNKIDLSTAIKTALLAFEDGMYTIFYGDDELDDLNTEINLEENKAFTFIRLTFLAGSYW